MSYQVRGLEPALFEQFFDLDDAALAGRGMRRVRADQPVGYPCRISLEDASVGEELLLLPFAHQDAATPFRASGPIFVRRGQPAAARVVNELPVCLTLRPLSVRAYDRADEMVDAEVIDGREATPLIERYLARADVAYLHVHFARRGCFACRIDRA
ncbi:MAG: DUF1203 domain-containing protein [Gammaproteobacteria bacterium]|nr:DUF1203 domain-containing protein [Gammaproteobacteria bacterium]